MRYGCVIPLTTEPDFVHWPARRRRPAVHEIVTRITRLRELSGATMTDDDVVVEGDSWGGFGQVRPPLGRWAEAGATWWVESWWDLPETAAGLAELRERIEAGPRRDLGG